MIDAPYSDFGFLTREIEVRIGGFDVRIAKVANPDDLMDALIAKGADHEDFKDERIPYWADLWPSAIGLSKFLVAQHIVEKGMKVLELGCGLGLPGIIAAKLGATVTLSDYLPEALDFARMNWLKNLDQPPQTVCLDWRHPDPEHQADLLIASDITYEARFFEALPNAFRVLCRPGGTVILSDPQRKVAQPFFNTLPALGFAVACLPVEIEWENTRRTIDLYKITI